MNIRLLCLLGALALTNTEALADQEPASGVAAAEAGNIKLIEDALHRHTAILASDAFGGRAPATEGETLTTAYLVKEFRALGLAPGNGDSYLQRVPVTELTIDAGTALTMTGKNFSAELEYGDEMVVSTEKQVEATVLEDSEMVFVGYGIVAPERNWNDYAGADVRGKTVVILVNDPGYATQDESLFNGNAMTWYGRWPYKYEEAARQGAAGALIVHETGAAAYGWEVVYNSWSRPQISLTAKDRNAGKSEVIGWLSQESARTLFAGAGLDYDAEVAVAEQPERYVTREPHPERGSYYRSDHFNFARHGVPALYAKSGEDSFAHGRAWGAKQAQDYTDQLYHSPQDEYNPGWDLSGAALDIMLYFEIGRRLSGESTYPNWYPGNEFRGIRDASASSRR